jgi:hypothetical protein
VSFLSAVETGVVVPFVEGAVPLAAAPLAGAACFDLGGIVKNKGNTKGYRRYVDLKSAER